MAAALACAHCALPVGRFGRQRELQGDVQWFCCHGCSLAWQVHHGERDEPEAAAWLIRLGVGGFLAMNIMLFSLLGYAGGLGGTDAWLSQPVHWLLWALATPMVLLIGGPFFAGAWEAARRGAVSTDTLVAVGVASAYGYSGWQVLQGSALVYFDTVSMVLLLFTLGRYLEAQGRVRALRSLVPMLEAAGAQVRVIDGATETLQAASQVRAGAQFRVLPGERVAVDGVVLAGRSACDESVLTGRPGLQPKAPGALVHAGSLNGDGPLWVRATVDGDQTHWVHIGRMVREALANKSMAGATVDRAVALFLPAVLALAAASAWYWSVHVGIDEGLLVGLAVLVVACPCSLGLAAPLVHALAIGAAAQRGILVRGGAVLERLALLRAVAFDKTGTLTEALLEPVGLYAEGASEAELLRVAGALAQGSDHPAARAVLRLAPPADAAHDLEVRAGAGIRGLTCGRHAALGSAGWLTELGMAVPAGLSQRLPSGCSALYIGWDGQARGLLALRAVPVAQAAAVLAALQARGLQSLLLSGDEAPAVAELAARLGVAHWQAGLLPHHKLHALRDWSAGHGATAMVGDGLNDGPVLAAAAVGIAVGHATDLAKESADVVLPRGALDALPWLLEHAAQVRRSVRANLGWAFGYNAVALGLAASGMLQPVIAAALMAGSSLLVVWRSWRADRRWNPRPQAGNAPVPAVRLAG